MVEKRHKKLRSCAIIVAILFSAWSCSLIFKISGYIKDPQLETRETIKAYCNDNCDPYDVLWMPVSRTAYDTILNRYPGLPTVTIYDKNMHVVENAGGEGCHKKLVAFFKDTSSTRYSKRIDNSWTVFEKYSDTVGRKAVPVDYYYTLVYSWVKYTPRMTKDLFRRLRDLKDSTQYKIRFYSLNKDYQKGVHSEAPKLKADNRQ